MRRGNSNWWIWLVIILGFNVFAELWPLVIIIAIVLGVTFASVESSKRRDQDTYDYTKTTSYRRSGGRYTTADISRINVYLRRWFRTQSDYYINGYNLRLSGSRYGGLNSLNVYQSGQYLGTMRDLELQDYEAYSNLVGALRSYAMSGQSQSYQNSDVIDVEIAPTQPKPQPKKEEPAKPKEEPKKKKDRAQEFIDQINSLNNNIPDEDISNGLYETSSLLTQIQTLEKKFPKSESKLEKLYDYYLPILVSILKQFDALQSATTDSSYEETRQKLSRNVVLINEAMRKIISSMTDQDFINLSADISTLEALLQKDGMTNEGQLPRKG